MRIAIVDDQTEITNHLANILGNADFQCEQFNDPKKFIKSLHTESYDLVVLDWQMPQMDGPDVVRWVREGLNLKMPIIFVTNLDSEAHIIEGLNVGADDYISKPIKRGEFVSRINAALRRYGVDKAQKNVHTFGPYEFNESLSQLKINDLIIDLTPKEMQLSLLLFKNLDKALSRNPIQDAIWGNAEHVSSRSMDVHLSRLRAKLHLNTPGCAFHLIPIYNFGYRLTAGE